MKALLMVFTLTVLMSYTGSSAIAETVSISAQLPGPAASYVHCWAAAGSATNKDVPFPCKPGTNVCGKTDTSGANITCDAQKTSDSGDSASAHSRAKVAGGLVLEANVPAPAGPSMNKVTFAAAAAYAQGGGQVQKQGVNKSSLLFVEIDKLKVNGRQDPVDDGVDLVVNNLRPEQVNYAFIQSVVPDKELLGQILEGFDESEFQKTKQSTTYLQVQAKITADGKLTATASAPLLCDAEKLMATKVDVHNLSSPKVQAAVERVLDHYQEFCSPQNNLVQTSFFNVKSGKDSNGQDVHVAGQGKTLEYVIVIPENTRPDLNDNVFSVNTIQFTSSRKEGQQQNIQQGGQLGPR